MSAPELTRELLMAIGGHQEMKKARALHREGGVQEADYQNGILSGQVRVGGKLKEVKMEIKSRSFVENHCKCLLVRRDGRVCAHGMALGLEVLEPTEQATSRSGGNGPASPKPTGPSQWPKVTDDGRALALEVMLPVKLAEAWQRGQLLTGFGVRDERQKEALLSALSPQDKVSLEPVDAELWSALSELFPEKPPGMVNLEPQGFRQLLEALPGHPRLFLGKKSQIEVRSSGPRRSIQLGGQGSRLKVNPGRLGAWEMDGDVVYPIAPGLPPAYDALFTTGLAVAAERARAELAFLERWFEIPDLVLDALPKEGRPEVRLRLEGSLRALDAQVAFYYGREKHSSPGGPPKVVGGFLTNMAAELAVLRFFRQWGFVESRTGGRLSLRDGDAILRFHAFAELPSEWVVEKGERFRAAAKQVVPIQPDWDWRGGGSGQDWFAVSTTFRAGDGEVSADMVQRMLRTGKTGQEVGKGRIAVLDQELVEEVFDTLADTEATQTGRGVFEVSTRQAAFLRASAQDFGIAVPEEQKVDLELPAHLRPYQKTGVEWLYTLSDQQLGGILADDMGLGKTLQTLTFLKERGGRSLVVCPSSLVPNWLAECEKWVPELSVQDFTGPKRGKLTEADITITSYAILRLDIAKLQPEEFISVVLDEAQQIKNPKAKVTLAANRIQAAHRFALSGTPVENSLQDLWSIMNFALPGYLGPQKVFLERFEKPLRQEQGDSALARRLSRKLKPVVLRRLKTEVAKDLPDRIEQVRYCELTPKQKAIYQRILEESRNQVADAKDGKKRMIALTALLRLRQACCDLRLLPGLKIDDQDAGIKLQELEQLLEEAVAGGHRVLVFSQFVQLLQGVVPRLMDRNWGYSYLDGATKRRGEVVKEFQEGKKDVFLISLKAGGVGLNLTAADTVIHLDPWWNPAIMAQATDRAHRIGQKNVVTSYQFITRGTVEEKILALQEEKKRLMDAALNGAPSLVPNLEEDELMGLFE